MNRNISRLAIPAVVLFAIGSSVFHSVPANANGDNMHRRMLDARPMMRHHESSPELTSAVNGLTMARTALSRTTTGFQGHRQRALDLIDKAMQQVLAAQQSDRR